MTIKIRVGPDESDTFRGVASKAVVVVKPLPASLHATLSHLKTLVDTKGQLLFVVNENDELEFVGIEEPRASSKHERRFRLRSWYDYNGWWIYSEDKNFGKRAESEHSSLFTLDVSLKDIRTKIKKRTIRK